MPAHRRAATSERRNSCCRNMRGVSGTHSATPGRWQPEAKRPREEERGRSSFSTSSFSTNLPRRERRAAQFMDSFVGSSNSSDRKTARLRPRSARLANDGKFATTEARRGLGCPAVARVWKHRRESQRASVPRKGWECGKSPRHVAGFQISEMGMSPIDEVPNKSAKRCSRNASSSPE